MTETKRKVSGLPPFAQFWGPLARTNFWSALCGLPSFADCSLTMYRFSLAPRHGGIFHHGAEQWDWRRPTDMTTWWHDSHEGISISRHYRSIRPNYDNNDITTQKHDKWCHADMTTWRDEEWCITKDTWLMLISDSIMTQNGEWLNDKIILTKQLWIMIIWRRCIIVLTRTRMWRKRKSINYKMASNNKKKNKKEQDE